MSFFASIGESFKETVGLKEESSAEENDEENQGSSLVPQVNAADKKKDDEIFITDIESSLIDVEKEKAAVDGDGELQQQIQSGDYLIHIFLEEARKLNVSDETQGIDIVPYLQVSNLKLSEYASTKQSVKSSSKLTWNEHIFMEANNVAKSDL